MGNSLVLSTSVNRNIFTQLGLSPCCDGEACGELCGLVRAFDTGWFNNVCQLVGPG